MNIAFYISSTGWGGLEMNTLKLARLLSEKNHDITLVSQEKSTIYHKGKNTFKQVVLIKKPGKYFDFIAAKKISNALKKQNIKSILVFDNKDIDVISWTKKLYFHDLMVIYQQHMQFRLNKKDFIHTLRYKSINYWISPLEHLKNKVLENTKVPEAKIKVIPIGVDIDKFIQKKYGKKEAQRLLNINPKYPLMGIIGRITEKKGQLFLVKALTALKNKGINLELLIFGSPTVNEPEAQEYFKKIKDIVYQNKLENRVHFVDFNEDVALFYNAIDIFALATESETYGMVTIEAMLSGVPAIATDSGGTSEILGFGKYGYLYEYNNTDDFCEKLISLLNNQADTNNKAILAKETASRKYNQKYEVQEIDKLLKNTLKI
ncbi:MAG: glycosyltransferase family 4 protein [Bacteroidales bacterium]|nr:glycosyltransferase family 4 protein [Bacteroidales bacterium]